MSWVADLITNVGTGGITGIVGGGVSLLKGYADSRLKLKELDITNKHEKEMASQDHANMLAEAEANLRITEKETTASMSISQDKLMEAGLEYAKTEIGNTQTEGIVLRFVEGMRRFFRPFASYYSIIILSIMSFWVYGLWEQMSLELTQPQAYELTKLMLETMIYMSTTTVFWWFTTRTGKPVITLGNK